MQHSKPTEFWRERLTLPAYRLGEAASYARISPQTVASWEKVYNHKSSVVSRRDKGSGLSFLELIEVAVVADLRRLGVKLDRIRKARGFFAERLVSKYPFAVEKFKTDGVDILLDVQDSLGSTVSDKLLIANENGQLIWSEFLQKRFHEFNYDHGIVVQWFVRGRNSELMIDPRICFGAPSVRGIMTRAIKNEWVTGQSVADIAEDFAMPAALVEEALHFEGIFVPSEEKRWLN